MRYDVTVDGVPAMSETVEPSAGHETFDGFILDDQTQSALTACLFNPPRAEHIWWTIMVVDPALIDTPSHVRLVGHYATEIQALDASYQLEKELNCCLVPGEAPLTTKPLGIEPEPTLIEARRASTSGSPAGRPRAR